MLDKKIKTIFYWLLLATACHAQNLDIDILKDINLNRNVHLDNTFIFVSNSVYPLVFGMPIGLSTYGYLKKDKVTKYNGFQVATSLIATEAIGLALKYSINRTRPYVKYPFIQNVVTEPDPSFPSGHTYIAFSLATSMTLAYPKWYVYVPAYAWASTVAFARLDLGVHYPSDVLCGMILGIGCAYINNLIWKKCLK